MLDGSALRGAFSLPIARGYRLPGLLLLIAWLLPLHVLPWMSWHNETVAALGATLGCLLALRLRTAGPGPIEIPAIAAAPLLLLLLAALQFLAGRIAYAGSLWAIASYAGLAVAAAAAGYAVARRGPSPGPAAAHPATDALACFVLAGATVQVLVVFAQTLGLLVEVEWVARTSYATRGGGNLAQPNQAGLLFVMGVCSGLYLHRTGRVRTSVAAALLFLLCAGLATAQSRSSMLGLLAVAGVHLWRGAGAPAGRVALPVIAAGAGLALFVAWPHLASAYWLLDAQAGVNVTSSGRLVMWSQLLEAVALRPWLGWGVMQVAEAQQAVAHAHASVPAATFSHNVLLDLVIWVGLPAAVLITWLLAAWWRGRLPRARSAAAVFAVALVLPFGIQSLTEFPFAYSYFILPVFFALGLLEAWTGPAARARIRRGWVLALLCGALFMQAWAVVEYVRIEEDFRIVRFEALKVGRTVDGYEPPRVLVLTQLGALLQATRLQARAGMTDEELALLGSVASFYPWGAPIQRYVMALALNGRIDEANRQLKVLRARHGERAFDALVPVLEEMAVEHPALKALQLH